MEWGVDFLPPVRDTIIHTKSQDLGKPWTLDVLNYQIGFFSFVKFGYDSYLK